MVTVQAILDLGDAPVFDAATDPCIMITVRNQPVSGHTYRGLMASNTTDIEKLNTIFEKECQVQVQEGGVHSPAGSGVSNLMEKLTHLGIPLEEFVQGKIWYGIKTGRNEAFFVDQATRDQLVEEDIRSAEILKPLVVGDNIRRYKLYQQGLW